MLPGHISANAYGVDGKIGVCMEEGRVMVLLLVAFLNFKDGIEDAFDMESDVSSSHLDLVKNCKGTLLSSFVDFFHVVNDESWNLQDSDDIYKCLLFVLYKHK